MNNRDLISFFVSGVASGLLFWIYEVGKHFSSFTALMLLGIITICSIGVVFVTSAPIFYLLRKYNKDKVIFISIFSMVISTVILCSFKRLYPWEYPIAPVIGFVAAFIFIWLRKILPNTIEQYKGQTSKEKNKIHRTHIY